MLEKNRLRSQRDLRGVSVEPSLDNFQMVGLQLLFRGHGIVRHTVTAWPG